MSPGKRELKMSRSLSWTKSIRLLIMGKAKFIISPIEPLLINDMKRTRKDMDFNRPYKSGLKTK